MIKKFLHNGKEDLLLKLFSWDLDIDYVIDMHRKSESTTFDDIDNFGEVNDEVFKKYIYGRIAPGKTLVYILWYVPKKGKPIRCGLLYLSDIIYPIMGTLHPIMDRDGYKKLLKDGVKRNVMKEGANVLLDYAFNSLHLQRVGGSFMKLNRGAINFCKKLGFKEEGDIRHATTVKGKPENLIMLGLLNKEFNDKEE